MKRNSWTSGCHFLVGIGLLATTCQVVAQDANAEVQAAFRKLLEAPNHTFKLTSETVPSMPQGKAEISGKTETNGWTHLTQTTPNGPFEFVFYRRKGVIKVSADWLTSADLIQFGLQSEKQSEGPRVMRKENTMLRGRKLPAQMALELVSRISSFKREGELYRAELSPEEATKMFGRGGNTSSISIPAKTLIQIRLNQQLPVSMEMHQRFAEGGVTQGFNVTMQFSDVGSTKVEPPPEAMQRVERVPAAEKTTLDAPVAAGSLSRTEAMELARKMEQQMLPIMAQLFAYYAANDWTLPPGKTSNEVFRGLFKTGTCEDEMVFAIPDARVRATRKLPDGKIGSVRDDFASAVSAGECDVTLAIPGPTATGIPGRPALRADIKASDGTIFVVIGAANGATRVVETRDGVVPARDAGGGDGFAQMAGVKDPILLKPE